MERTAGIIDAGRVRLREIPRPASDVIEGFTRLPDLAGVVARALDQLGIASTIPSATLGQIAAGRVVGPAITVRNIPARDVPHKQWQGAQRSMLGEREAFFLARDGDVVVIDGASAFPASCLGSLSVMLAERLGVSGIVVSGAVTGVDGIRESRIPVWAIGGTTVTGHHRVETVELNGQIGIHGVRVDPGDLVVGDGSGITVVPLLIAEEALRRASEMRGLGARIREMIVEGASRDELRDELGDWWTKFAAIGGRAKPSGDPPRGASG
jgi:regulator of RNase E activity RraA